MLRSLQPQSVTLISTRFWQWSSVRCGCLGRNTKCCNISSVLGLRTPLLRQGGMTDFFLSYTFFAICGSSYFLFEESIFIAYYRVSCFMFFSVSAGQHFKSRPCLLGLWGMYYRLCAVVCFIFYWRCHFVQESFGIIFAEGAYAPGDLV